MLKSALLVGMLLAGGSTFSAMAQPKPYICDAAGEQTCRDGVILCQNRNCSTTTVIERNDYRTCVSECFNRYNRCRRDRGCR